MKIMPISTIKLITSPFKKKSDSCKLKWVTQKAQREFFDEITGAAFAVSQYTIIDNGVIRINQPYSNLEDYNYLYFSDDRYGNKRFYCFINDIKEISTGICYIYFEIDSIQTWGYDGSRQKYLSKAPTGTIKAIIPETLKLHTGTSQQTLQFSVIFADENHVSTLAEYSRAAYNTGGVHIHISNDGILTVDPETPAGATFVVLARDVYDSSISATCNITVED